MERPRPLVRSSGSRESAQSGSRRHLMGSSWRDLPQLPTTRAAEAEETPLSDSEEASLYVACFWPLHVWRRETRLARQLQTRMVEQVADGLARQRLFRAWASEARKRRAYAKATHAVRKRVSRGVRSRAFRRLAAAAVRNRRVRHAANSRSFARLRARCLAKLPMLAWRVYARCRSLVRNRSYGSTMLRREAMVPPLPFPPEWRTDAGFERVVSRAIVKDTQARQVNRHRRRRLAAPLFEHMLLNVQLQRRKRWCLLRGFRLIYAHALGRWCARPPPVPSRNPRPCHAHRPPVPTRTPAHAHAHRPPVPTHTVRPWRV